MKFRFLILFVFHSLISFSQTNQAKEIIQRMLKANEKLNTAKFTLHSEERLMNGKFAVMESFVKLSMRPKQVYFYAVKPDPGTEILWHENKDDNKMTVSPGSFPYVTFKMKLTNSLARKDAHHTLDNMGFDYVTGIISYYLNFYGDRFYKYIKIEDSVQWNGRSCVKMDFDFSDYAEKNYTVIKNEKITDIAKRLHLNEYSLLMLNPAVSDYDDVKPGQIIKISNFYSRRIVFYIDRMTSLPLCQMIYDTKGLYEKYEMKSFQFNPIFKADEFSPTFKDYSF